MGLEWKQGIHDLYRLTTESILLARTLFGNYVPQIFNTYKNRTGVNDLLIKLQKSNLTQKKQIAYVTWLNRFYADLSLWLQGLELYGLPSSRTRDSWLKLTDIMNVESDLLKRIRKRHMAHGY